MEKEDGNETNYIQKVQGETQRFIQTLMADNEKLRALVATLGSENLRMKEDFSKVQQALEHREKEQERLQKQMTEVAAENLRFSEQYAEVDRQNSNLANLYVAGYRLHGTLNRDEVLAVILEIIINMIGSEELGVFEVEQGKKTLSLLASFGIDEAHYRNLSFDSGIIGEVAAGGNPYFANKEEKREFKSPEEANLTACIPLKVEGKITGAIAVFRLLGHKSGLEDIDRELFDLLATQAAMALHATGLYAKVTAGSIPRA
jgi:regulator of replication initiation timing